MATAWSFTPKDKGASKGSSTLAPAGDPPPLKRIDIIIC
jgi:hypothetical protein